MAKRGMGDLVATYEKKGEPVLVVFLAMAFVFLVCLGCTGFAIFGTDVKTFWVCSGIVTLLALIATVMLFVSLVKGEKDERSLRVYEHGLIQKDSLSSETEEVYWDDIAAVNYQSDGLLAGVYLRTYQNVEIKICFTFKENNKIYVRICKKTKERLLEEILGSLHAGATVKFGPELSIDDEVVCFFLKKIFWKDIEKIELWDVYVKKKGFTFLDSRELRFFVRGAWFNKTVSRDRMENLHVFLDLARTRYNIECIGTGKLG
jgi:hypothetical protein